MPTKQGEELEQLRAKWLKLPDVPNPTPHQLLGVREDDYDLHELNRAFQSRFRRVQRYEMGRYSDAAVAILRELSEAVDELRNRVEESDEEAKPPSFSDAEFSTTTLPPPPPQPTSPSARWRDADEAGQDELTVSPPAVAQASDAESSSLHRVVTSPELVVGVFAYDYRGLPLAFLLSVVVTGIGGVFIGLSWQTIVLGVSVATVVAALSWQRIALTRSLGQPPILSVTRTLGYPIFGSQQAVLTPDSKVHLEDRNTWEFNVGLEETTCFAFLCLTGAYSSGSLLSIRVTSPDATDSLMFTGCSSQFYGRQFKQLPPAMIVVHEGLRRVDVELETSTNVFG